MLIGELMRATGLSRDTIRFYEQQGLLTSRLLPAGSRAYRDYPPEMVERLQEIRQAQSAGFTLREIKGILEKWGEGASQIPEEEIVCLLTAKIEQIEQRLCSLHAVRDYLEEKRDRIQNR